MHRNKFDLSHLSHICGHIGRLQTACVIPVEAGCSLSINLDGIGRLAPNRKEIVSECQVDICAFHVPYRIVYGQSWIDLLKSGPDATPAFTGVSVGSVAAAPYLTLPTTNATINKALLQGYNRIYYNYYAVPSIPTNPDLPSDINTNFDWFPSAATSNDANCRNYGRLAARLPHVLNGGNVVDAAGVSGWEAQSLTVADSTVAAAGSFDIRDLSLVQARFDSEASRAWYKHFYQDIIEMWGGKVNRDVDPTNLRPEFLGRSTHMLSGRDIDGSDDATLGTFQGKTLDRVSFNMPRKFFDEHGLVFVLVLFRYPLVHTREAHPLLQAANWSYDDIVAEPGRYAALKPINFDPGAWLTGSASFTPVAQVQQPYGQHLRYQPNRVHPNFQTIPGYPFSNFDGTALTDWMYYQNNEYKETFQTTQIGHWQMQARVGVEKLSLLPGVDQSIMVGT